MRRVPKPIKALHVTRQITAADNTARLLEAKIDLVKSYRSAGEVYKAKQILIDVELEFSAAQIKDLGQEINYHHTCSLVLRDLEQNKEVLNHAKVCLKGYEENGDIQLQLISMVNFCDALSAMGYETDAGKLLAEACQTASDHQLPHAQGIAYLCYANVLTDSATLDQADCYYQKGLALAKQTGHDRDAIYGEIYYGLFQLNCKLSLSPG